MFGPTRWEVEDKEANAKWLGQLIFFGIVLLFLSFIAIIFTIYILILCY